jgi:hypothetical protein
MLEDQVSKNDAELVKLREAIREIRELASEHYDPDADPADTSPEDNVAHVNGLIVKLCDGVKS